MKKRKKRGKGRKEQRERNFSNTGTGAPTRISPWVKADDRKYQNQTLVIITQSLKYETNNGNLGPMYFFRLAWHLKFFPIRSFSRPQFPMLYQEFPIFPLHHQRAQIFHFVIEGPKFPHHVIKMMTSNFSSRYQGVSIYHCVIKGPRCVHSFSIKLSKGPIVYSSAGKKKPIFEKRKVILR